MARYIDIEPEIQELHAVLNERIDDRHSTTYYTFEKVLEKLKSIPTADVTEIKHGKWLKTNAYPHKVYCSVCYKTYVENEEIIAGRGWRLSYCTEAEYCPHCGAKMDEEW